MQKKLLLLLVITTLFSFTACSGNVEQVENTVQDNSTKSVLYSSENIANLECKNTNNSELSEETVTLGDALELKDIHLILKSLKGSYSFSSTDDDVITFFTGKVQGALTIEPYYNDNSKLAIHDSYRVVGTDNCGVNMILSEDDFADLYVNEEQIELYFIAPYESGDKFCYKSGIHFSQDEVLHGEEAVESESIGTLYKYITLIINKQTGSMDIMAGWDRYDDQGCLYTIRR